MNSTQYLLPVLLTHFAAHVSVICMHEVESIMNLEKSNFIPIRIKSYFIYIDILCLKAIIIKMSAMSFACSPIMITQKLRACLVEEFK